ncbi:MAG TPA: MauE/DoxX family redox-associated membrane protein [Hyphomicrobiales bacterium]|jgi:hypothetical protein
MLNDTIDVRTDEVSGQKSCCGSRKQSIVDPPRTDPLKALRQYQPILVIAGAALAGSLLLSSGHQHGAGALQVMPVFMGLFLFPLALLKLFDIGGFAEAFARYDVVAKIWPAYGRLYPFLELALALLFLSGLWPDPTHVAAFVIGTIGTVGIVRTLMSGEQLRCACVGSSIEVPLGLVSILENAGMAAMAAFFLMS